MREIAATRQVAMEARGFGFCVFGQKFRTSLLCASVALFAILDSATAIYGSDAPYGDNCADNCGAQ